MRNELLFFGVLLILFIVTLALVRRPSGWRVLECGEEVGLVVMGRGLKIFRNGTYQGFRVD